MTPQEAIDSLGLKIRAQFVPLSRSRDAGGDPHFPTLNWSVTLVRVHGPGNEAGRDVLTTDYSAGMAHCPAYKRKPPRTWDRPDSMWKPLACAWECEHGKPAAYFSWNRDFVAEPVRASLGAASGAAIKPDSLDVIYSLVQDASALDAGGFADWAAELGFDSDSIKAKATYDSCLEIALKLRNAIGDAGLETLQAAFQDY